MSAFTFDTIKYVNMLKQAGVPSEQAEGYMQVLTEAIAEGIEQKKLKLIND